MVTLTKAPSYQIPDNQDAVNKNVIEYYRDMTPIRPITLGEKVIYLYMRVFGKKGQKLKKMPILMKIVVLQKLFN